MKLFSIIGARPQFIKVAPVCRAIEASNKHGHEIEDIIVHTGQHYDASMSDVFFDELKIPKPTYNLGVGSSSHGVQTGDMLAQIDQLLQKVKPDMVVIYGDTNSTVAGALAAAKLHIPVTHIEAGLRSFNRKMPEEVNRIVADHISDLLLVPTQTGMDNLEKENLISRAKNVGDVMFDAVLFNKKLAKQNSTILQDLDIKDSAYAMITVHRAENTDNLDNLRLLMTAFNDLAESGLTMIFPIHPRTKNKLKEMSNDWQPHTNLKLIEPVGYLDMLSLVENAQLVLTDSGGLQKEAFFLGCPCITLREETEWLETVSFGGNVVVGTDSTKITKAVSDWKSKIDRNDLKFRKTESNPFGDGDTASKIIDAILNYS